MDTARGIDEQRRPGARCAHQPPASLDGAKAREGELLSRARTEITIAGEVHEDVDTLARVAARKVGKDGFPADEGPDAEPIGREREPLDVSGADLAARIAGPPATYLPDLDAVADHVAAAAPPGAWVLTMGAGDVERVGPLLLEKLRARR